MWWFNFWGFGLCHLSRSFKSTPIAAALSLKEAEMKRLKEAWSMMGFLQVPSCLSQLATEVWELPATHTIPPLRDISGETRSISDYEISWIYMINRLILIFLFLDAADGCQCFNLILIVPGPKELDIQKREAGQVVLLGNYDGGPTTKWFKFLWSREWRRSS